MILIIKHLFHSSLLNIWDSESQLSTRQVVGYLHIQYTLLGWLSIIQTFQLSRFGMPTDGFTVLPLNLTKSQKTLKLQNNPDRYEGISKKTVLITAKTNLSEMPASFQWNVGALRSLGRVNLHITFEHKLKKIMASLSILSILSNYIPKKKNQQKSKSSNKVKNTLKQIICHHCFHLTHIWK